MSTIEEKVAKQIQYQRDMPGDGHSLITVEDMTTMISEWTRGDAKRIRVRVERELLRLREIGELRDWNDRTPHDGRYLINGVINPDYAAVIEPLLPVDGPGIYAAELHAAASVTGLSDQAIWRTITAMMNRGHIKYAGRGFGLIRGTAVPSATNEGAA